MIIVEGVVSCFYPNRSILTYSGIRCDGEFPCNQCGSASLTCKREHVPKRRGPKRGTGRVINELRAKDGDERPEDKSNGTLSSGPS